MKKSHRKNLLLAAKTLIALILLGWVISQVHWHDYVDDAGVAHVGFASSIRDVKPLILASAVAVYAINMFVMAYRWRLLLKVADIRISIWEAIRLNFLGLFFNLVVPGTVGGDIVKAYYVSKHTPNKAASLVSVLMDRVLGLTELTILAAVMLFATSQLKLAPWDNLRLPAAMIAAVVAILILAFLFLFSRRLRKFLHLERFYQHLSFAHHLRAAGQATHLYRQNVGVLIAAILITFIGHVAWIGSIVLTGASLSLPIPWYNYFLYIPLIYIIGAVPLTPGGVGLIEKFYMVFFASPACTPSAILALALLARLLPMAWSMPGAVVAVIGPHLPKAEAMKAELGLANDSPPDNFSSETSVPAASSGKGKQNV